MLWIESSVKVDDDQQREPSLHASLRPGALDSDITPTAVFQQQGERTIESHLRGT